MMRTRVHRSDQRAKRGPGQLRLPGEVIQPLTQPRYRAQRSVYRVPKMLCSFLLA